MIEHKLTRVDGFTFILYMIWERWTLFGPSRVQLGSCSTLTVHKVDYHLARWTCTLADSREPVHGADNPKFTKYHRRLLASSSEKQLHNIVGWVTDVFFFNDLIFISADVVRVRWYFNSLWRCRLRPVGAPLARTLKVSDSFCCF